MTTTTPSAATTFIDIGERTNVTSLSVMLGLGPSIQRAAREDGLGICGSVSAEFFRGLPVSSWILGTSPRMTVWGVSGARLITLGGARA
jgi:hypothetical protein